MDMDIDIIHMDISIIKTIYIIERIKNLVKPQVKAQSLSTEKNQSIAVVKYFSPDHNF